jgi:hypothetical protein
MGDGVAQTFKHPHPNECRGPDALLLSHRPQLLERVRIQTDGEAAGETLAKTDADRRQLRFIVRGANMARTSFTLVGS